MAKKKSKKKYQKLLNELLVLLDKKQKKNELDKIIEDIIKKPKSDNISVVKDPEFDDCEEDEECYTNVNSLDISLFNGLDPEFVNFLDVVFAHEFMITKENLIGIRINQIYRNCKRNETLFRCCAKVNNSEDIERFYSRNLYLEAEYLGREDEIESNKKRIKEIAKSFEFKDIYICILMSFDENNKCVKITIMRDSMNFCNTNIKSKKYIFEYEK